jgi:CheY-like chemotaxis protein
MSGDQVAKILAALPPILWVALAIFAFHSLRGALVPMLARMASVEGFGVKLALSSAQALGAAVELARKQVDPTLEVPQADRQAALDRAKREQRLLDGAEILWVDDVPSHNRNEARMLRSFGAMITFACTTEEAVQALHYAAEQSQPYHLIISDIGREMPVADPQGGIAMLARLRQEKVVLPVIFYIGRLKPGAGVPPGAFGLTNRPDQLLQLALDALARVRGGA